MIPRGTSRGVQLIPFYRLIYYAIVGFGLLSIIPPFWCRSMSVFCLCQAALFLKCCSILCVYVLLIYISLLIFGISERKLLKCFKKTDILNLLKGEYRAFASIFLIAGKVWRLSQLFCFRCIRSLCGWSPDQKRLLCI